MTTNQDVHTVPRQKNNSNAEYAKSLGLFISAFTRTEDLLCMYLISIINLGGHLKSGH
jgi:hypothetical protein